jgi:hypothetical protein
MFESATHRAVGAPALLPCTLVTSLRSPRHDFEKGTSIGRVGLVLRAGPVQNVGARSGRALLINKRARKNIQVFVVFVVFNDTHPVSRVPLDQHCQLTRSQIHIEDLATRARPNSCQSARLLSTYVMSSEFCLPVMMTPVVGLLA